MAEGEAISSGFNDQNQDDDYEDGSDEDDSREYIETEKRPPRSTKQPLLKIKGGLPDGKGYVHP